MYSWSSLITATILPKIHFPVICQFLALRHVIFHFEHHIYHTNQPRTCIKSHIFNTNSSLNHTLICPIDIRKFNTVFNFHNWCNFETWVKICDVFFFSKYDVKTSPSIFIISIPFQRQKHSSTPQNYSPTIIATIKYQSTPS
jgi:hypothetical protein